MAATKSPSSFELESQIFLKILSVLDLALFLAPATAIPTRRNGALWAPVPQIHDCPVAILRERTEAKSECGNDPRYFLTETCGTPVSGCQLIDTFVPAGSVPSATSLSACLRISAAAA